MTIEIAGHEFEGVFTDPYDTSIRKGVYVVLCLVDGEPHCVLDIGTSSKIQERLRGHGRKTCWRDNAHGEIGYCVKYTSTTSDINAREHAPPAARKGSEDYSLKERHILEEELQWKLEYACGSNPWKIIEQEYERYESYEETFGSRGSYGI